MRAQETRFATRLAGWALVLAALAAPWLAGAQTTIPGGRWGLGGVLVLAFLLTVAGRFAAQRWLAIPWSAGGCAVFLLGCLAWWTAQPEPHFATVFGENHWAFLKDRQPYSMVLLPRLERLGYLACVIFGFLAAIDLGRRENLRDALTFAIGLSGMGVALYALGFAHFGWPALPWMLIDGGNERFNVCFSLHNGPPSCLNLAWPLLVFASAGRFPWWRRIAPLALTAAAMPLWESKSGMLIATGLLLAGLSWLWATKGEWLTPWLVRTGLGVALVAVLACQCVLIFRMQTRTPDPWISAQDTLFNAPERDAALLKTAEHRGDHLVASSAPDRPATWLAAARMAADYPLIGLGPGAWAKRSALYSLDPLVNTFHLCRLFAHHDSLQFAAEWGGVPVLGALFLFLGGLFRAPSRDTARPVTDVGITLALLGVALHSTVDSPLQNPALQLWTALLLGLAWSELRTKTRSR